MANVRLKFFGTENSKTEEISLECFANFDNEIYIEIESEGYPPSYICLDVSTAIKLAKVLRSEINKAKEVEND